MGYNTDVYILREDGKLNFQYSASGSDAPYYFDDVKTLTDANDVREYFLEDKDTWFSTRWGLPWKTSKRSDDCIILEPIKRKFYEFWKRKDQVKVWVSTYYNKREGDLRNDETKMWFSDIPVNQHYDEYGQEERWKLKHLRLFTLPIMK